MPYVKLDTDILTSSVWVQDHETFRVWIYLLAVADQNGTVRATIPAMALMCQVTVQKVKSVLDAFSAPDPDSRNPSDDGRRIAIFHEPEFVIEVLNYERYRAKDYTAAERMKSYRARKKAGELRVTTVTERNSVTQAEGISRSKEQKAEAKAKKEKASTRVRLTKFTPPTVEAVEAYLAELHEKRFTAEHFVDYYAVRGWKLKGGAMKDWKAAVRTWRHNEDARGGVKRASQLSPQDRAEAFVKALPESVRMDSDYVASVFQAFEQGKQPKPYRGAPNA
jgi:hypothetical protein